MANKEDEPAPVRDSNLAFFTGRCESSSSSSSESLVGLATVKMVRFVLGFGSAPAGGGSDKDDFLCEAAAEGVGLGCSLTASESLSSLA